MRLNAANGRLATRRMRLHALLATVGWPHPGAAGVAAGGDNRVVPQPKIPPGLKILRNDPVTGRDTRGKRAPSIANLPRIVPDVPSYVAEDSVARAEWDRVVPILQRARLLHEASQTAVGLYCAAVSRAIYAHRLYLSGEGSYRELADMDRAVRAWAGQLGLTPATEDVLVRCIEETPDEDDPFAWHGDNAG
jgi:phage terminase small subunit